MAGRFSSPPPRHLDIPAVLRPRLRESFTAAYPRECCGVLLGKREGDRVLVSRVVNTLNAFSGIGSFAIPDHELARARLLAAELKLAIVAVFHSHPDGSAELSSGDRAALAHSEWPWVLLTLHPTTGEITFAWWSPPSTPE